MTNYVAEESDMAQNDNSGGNAGEARTRPQMSQKEAVYNAIVNVKGGEDEIRSGGQVQLSNDERQAVKQELFDRFKNGEIQYSGDYPDDKALMTYCTGLVSNWLRKDDRLNGGKKYEPKNPGIRQGAGDEQLKALKGLLAQTHEESARRDIQAAIEKRQEELKPKREPININALPAHLRKYAEQLQGAGE